MPTSEIYKFTKQDLIGCKYLTLEQITERQLVTDKGNINYEKYTICRTTGNIVQLGHAGKENYKHNRALIGNHYCYSVDLVTIGNHYDASYINLIKKHNLLVRHRQLQASHFRNELKRQQAYLKSLEQDKLNMVNKHLIDDEVEETLKTIGALQYRINKIER